jgi:hypothetical protein
MKLMSGRRYKHALSDIVGVLWEQEESGKPLSREAIDSAVALLYGADAAIPEASAQLLDAVFAAGDYEALYRRTRDGEIESQEILTDFERRYPGQLKGESIDGILQARQRKREDGQREAMLALLEEKKRAALHPPEDTDGKARDDESK